MEREPIDADDSSSPGWWWILDPRHSLRARTALVFGGGSALFIALLGWIAGVSYQRQLEGQLGATFENQAAQISDKLDRTIYDYYRTLQFTTILAPFRAANAKPAERRQALEALQDVTPEFGWLGFVDSTGRIVAGTRGIFEGESAADRIWFRSGREGLFVGPLHDIPELADSVTTTDGEPLRFLDVAVPVSATNGQFLGILGAHVQWSWARDVQRSVIPDAARRDHLGATIYASSGAPLLDSGGSGWTEPPEAPASRDLRRPRGSILEHTAGGTTYLTGYVRSRGFREYHGVGWLITVRQPIEYAFAPVHDFRLRILHWGIFFVSVFTLASWIAADRLARRLHGVAATADRIRSGDVLAVMPRPRGESEFAQMCAALGHMVDDFRQREEKLVTDNNAHVARQDAKARTTPVAPRVEKS